MVKIELEEDEKPDKEEMPVYVTAIFIAVSGLGFLIFTIYYIAFLPVPSIMQPLRVRILTALQLEKALQEELSLVTIINAPQIGLEVYGAPDEASAVVARVTEGGFYEKIEETDEWVKIQAEDDLAVGWVKKEHVKNISEE